MLYVSYSHQNGWGWVGRTTVSSGLTRHTLCVCLSAGDSGGKQEGREEEGPLSRPPAVFRVCFSTPSTFSCFSALWNSVWKGKCASSGLCPRKFKQIDDQFKEHSPSLCAMSDSHETKIFGEWESARTGLWNMSKLVGPNTVCVCRRVCVHAGARGCHDSSYLFQSITGLPDLTN